MSCLICFNNYNEKPYTPLVLPCGHDCCKECLLSLYQNSRQRNKGIECPSCRVFHKISPNQLTVVYALINKENSKPKVKKCEKPDCLEQPYRFCEHCSITMCQRHYNEDRDMLQQTATSYLVSANNKLSELSDVLILLKNEQEKLTSGYSNAENTLNALQKSIQQRITSLSKERKTNETKLATSVTAASDKKWKIETTALQLEELWSTESDNNELHLQQQLLERILETNIVAIPSWNANNNFETEIKQMTDKCPTLYNHNVVIQEKSIQSRSVSAAAAGEGIQLPDAATSVPVSVENLPDNLQIANSKIMKLDFQPLDIAICKSTNGYSIDGHQQVVHKTTLLTNVKGQMNLPNVCYFVSQWDDDSKLIVLNTAGAKIGFAKLELTRAEPSLQSLSVCNSLQRLYMSDIDNQCVHVTNLAGRSLDVIGGEGTQLFGEVRGLYIDDKEDDGRLYVCDAEKNAIQVFQISQLGHALLHTLKDQSMKVPQYLSINPTTNELWVINFETPDIAIFDQLSDQPKFKKIIKANLSSPWGIAHSILGNAYITGTHYIQQLTQQGKQLKMFGGEKNGSDVASFNMPTGVAVYCSHNQRYVIICDKKNQRLKLFRLC